MSQPIPSAAATIAGGVVHFILVQVSPPTAEEEEEHVLLRVWRRLDDVCLLEGMIKGTGALPLRYIAPGTFQGC